MPVLQEGLSKFQTNAFKERERLFKELKHGQNPDVLFITCSDSRVVPGLLTQTEPGDLFVLRNAGNLIPEYGKKSSEEATIEYAVNVLNVSHIVICGHSHCGAMQGVLQPEKIKDLPALFEVLASASPNRASFLESHTNLKDDALLKALIQDNVLKQKERLLNYPYIREKVQKGKLQIHAWLYEFETGTVFEHQSQSEQFEPYRIEHGAHEVVEEKDVEKNQLDGSFLMSCLSATAVISGGMLLVAACIMAQPGLLVAGIVSVVLGAAGLLRFGMFKPTNDMAEPYEDNPSLVM